MHGQYESTNSIGKAALGGAMSKSPLGGWTGEEVGEDHIKVNPSLIAFQCFNRLLEM